MEYRYRYDDAVILAEARIRHVHDALQIPASAGMTKGGLCDKSRSV